MPDLCEEKSEMRQGDADMLYMLEEQAGVLLSGPSAAKAQKKVKRRCQRKAFAIRAYLATTWLVAER